MSHRTNKKEVREAKQEASSVQKMNRNQLNATTAPIAEIKSRSNLSILMIILFGVILIGMKTFAIIGWILFVLSGILFAFGKNVVQFGVYPDYLVIYALDDSELCWKVPYKTMKYWNLHHSWVSLSTLTIETSGNTAQKMEVKFYKYHDLAAALKKAAPDLEVKTLPAQPNQK